MYCNDPKFSDRQHWANSVDPDQTAQSDQALPCLSFYCHPMDALLYGKATLLTFEGDYSKFFGRPNF